MTVLLRQIHNNLICACVLIILFPRLGLEGERGGGETMELICMYRIFVQNLVMNKKAQSVTSERRKFYQDKKPAVTLQNWLALPI